MLVTGASRGIGRAIAEELAQAGFHMVLNHRASGERAHEVAEGIRARGGQASVLAFDVAERGSQALLSADVEAHGAY